MEDHTETKPESRLKTALHTGGRFASSGAVFGYVAHLFFGNPKETGFVSRAAAQSVVAYTAFMGVVGTIIGAIWPDRHGRRMQQPEAPAQPQSAQPPSTMEMETGTESPSLPAPEQKSHTADITARREAVAAQPPQRGA